MDIEFNGSYVVYALGVFLGVLSVFYFGFEIFLSLSPVTKSLMLLSLAVSVFAIGLHFSGGMVSVPVYLTGAFSYLVFVSYTLLKFRPGKLAEFALLLASSAVFFMAGYWLNRTDFSLGRSPLIYFLMVLGFFSLSLMAFDATGPEVSSDLVLRDTVRLQEGELVRIGSLIARNRFLLSRNPDISDYGACSERIEHLEVDMKRPDLVPGNAVKNISLKLRVFSGDKDFTAKSFRLQETARCPENPENSTIYIFRQDYGLD